MLKSEGFQRYLRNTSWLFVDRVVRLAAVLVSSIFITRYLGPSLFGELNYASAFVGMVGDDAFGHFLADTLAQCGVDVGPLRYTAKARTALAFVSLRADGEREFMFYRHPSADMMFTPGEVDTAAIAAAEALHFDSISLASENPRACSLFAAEQAANDVDGESPGPHMGGEPGVDPCR